MTARYSKIRCAPIAMPSPLRINYLILDEPDPNKIRYITIDSNQTVQDLQKAIASEHLLAAQQISKLEGYDEVVRCHRSC